MTDAFLQLADPWGRPVWLRPSAVAVLEGAHDAADPHGDLWTDHPLRPYHKLTLSSGAALYLAADDGRALADALGL